MTASVASTPAHERQPATLALTGFVGPVRNYPRCRGIHGLLVDQAKRTPWATAVSSAERDLTYRQLDRCSDALCRELIARGVAAGDFVGICMDRSLQMVVAVMGVLKTGAAFLPLDIEHPRERLLQMLADATPNVALVDAKGASLLDATGVETVVADNTWLDEPDSSVEPVNVDPGDHGVACALYTSGSTGLPKGVLSTHRGIVNNVRAIQELYQLTPDDCMLHQTSIGFDAASFEIYWPLSIGARLYIARPNGQREPDYLIDVIAEQRIRTIGFAPGMLSAILGMKGFTQNRQIKRVMCYGDVLSPRLAAEVHEKMPVTELCNLYGPSETSIVVTEWTCERNSSRETVPIGRPLPNTEVYILDSDLNPVEPGVEGEIYVGGVCVANGYHNRPSLTAERFLPHPFRPESGDKVYRTGDIARIDDNGVIEFVGRRDKQVKIRGMRVELEEVEAELEKIPGVDLSVVIAAKDTTGDVKLIAYVGASSDGITPEVVRVALTKTLPDAFRPAQIICLPRLPLNLNGKVDRSRLPDPSAFIQATASASDSPRDDLQARLTLIWRDMLGIHDFGVRDSFFDIGGHSLMAVIMIERISEELGLRVSLRSFYEDPSIEGISRMASGQSHVSSRGKNWGILSVKCGAPGRPMLFYLNGQPSGSGSYARELAKFLSPAQGFSIVPVPIFHRRVTVEAVASRTLELIREEQPEGPYVLGGNCFGATVALEIAQQLVRNGETVSLLALIHPDARVAMHPGYRAMRRLSLIAGLDQAAHFAEFRGPVDFTFSTLGKIVDHQRRGSPRDLVERVSDGGRWMSGFIARAARHPISTWENPESPIAEDELKTMGCNESCDDSAARELSSHVGFMSEAWTRYKPVRYEGRVAIIWPREGPANPPWNPRALWDSLTPQLDWHFVPGNHWTMLDEHFDKSAEVFGLAVERVASE
jgi:amino acid adenylation domain